MNLKENQIPKSYILCNYMYLLLVNGKIRDEELVTDIQGSGIKMVLEGRRGKYL